MPEERRRLDWNVAGQTFKIKCQINVLFTIKFVFLHIVYFCKSDVQEEKKMAHTARPADNGHGQAGDVLGEQGQACADP